MSKYNSVERSKGNAWQTLRDCCRLLGNRTQFASVAAAAAAGSRLPLEYRLKIPVRVQNSKKQPFSKLPGDKAKRCCHTRDSNCAMPSNFLSSRKIEEFLSVAKFSQPLSNWKTSTSSSILSLLLQLKNFYQFPNFLSSSIVENLFPTSQFSQFF